MSKELPKKEDASPVHKCLVENIISQLFGDRVDELGFDTLNVLACVEVGKAREGLREIRLFILAVFKLNINRHGETIFGAGFITGHRGHRNIVLGDGAAQVVVGLFGINLCKAGLRKDALPQFFRKHRTHGRSHIPGRVFDEVNIDGLAFDDRPGKAVYAAARQDRKAKREEENDDPVTLQYHTP